METPVLSSKLIGKALSSKKATPKSIRAVLTTPRENFRPIVSDVDEQIITNMFKTTFPCYIIQKIPWEDIKNVPKEKRKEFRNNFNSNNLENRNKFREMKKYYIVGLNNIIKKLEKNQIEAVILSPNVLDSKPLYDYVIRLCKLSKTPVVIFNIESLYYELYKIKTLGLAFLKESIESEVFQELISKVKLIYNEFTKESGTGNKTIDRMNVDQVPKISNIDMEKPLDNKTELLAKDVIESSEKVQSMEISDVSKVNPLYLYRDSTKTRVFIPGSKTTQEKVTNMEVDNSDYISFSKPVEKVTEIKSSNVKYQPMKIKKIIGNPNRKRKRKT